MWVVEPEEMLQKCEEETGDRLSMVKQLLGSRKTMQVVMNFLGATMVSQQLHKQEQQEEKQRKHGDDA